MDVVSFNVFVSRRSRGVRARAAELCRRLTDLDVDVLLLQEVWTPSLLRFIGARLPSLGHSAWRPGLAGQPAGGLAVFANRPLHRPTYTRFTAASLGLQGVLTVRTTDGALVLGNTQLTANRDGDWSRTNRHHSMHREQLLTVHEAMRAAGAHTVPSILGGDFNIASTSPLYPAIVDHGAWHDPFAAGDHPTYRAEYLPAGQRPHRIDYLLASGHEVTSADLVLTEPTHRGGFLSDHLAPRIRLSDTTPRDKVVPLDDDTSPGH